MSRDGLNLIDYWLLISRNLSIEWKLISTFVWASGVRFPRLETLAAFMKLQVFVVLLCSTVEENHSLFSAVGILYIKNNENRSFIANFLAVHFFECPSTAWTRLGSNSGVQSELLPSCWRSCRLQLTHHSWHATPDARAATCRTPWWRNKNRSCEHHFDGATANGRSPTGGRPVM